MNRQPLKRRRKRCPGRRLRRIGLLGGSFNPAHEGHLHISRMALQRLALDEIWWLVSPQNPLKPSAGMAPLAARLDSAAGMARHPRIRVTDLEQQLGTRYTVDTLRALCRRHRDCRFIWLMGADNLGQMPHWKSWTAIFGMVGIAVFARPKYSLKALSGLAASRYAKFRLPERAAAHLAIGKPPEWVFLKVRLHPASSTAIRAGLTDRQEPPQANTTNGGSTERLGNRS